MAEDNLVKMIRWLRADQRPHYALLPRAEYRGEMESVGPAQSAGSGGGCCRRMPRICLLTKAAVRGFLIERCDFPVEVVDRISPLHIHEHRQPSQLRRAGR